MTGVEVEGLSKRFGKQIALADVSLSLSEGVIYGLAGANGSGKTVMLRIMAALERPSAGRVRVAGHDLAANPAGVRREVGFVPEAYRAIQGFTVAEQLDFASRCRGLSKAERKATVETMLELVGLRRRVDDQVAALSQGQQQRLALATAMLHDPTVLLLDQPLAGLDTAGRLEMLEVLAELRSMGKTVVLTTHGMRDMVELCDAVGVLHRGRLVASGAPGELVPKIEAEGVIVEVKLDGEAARDLVAQIPEVLTVNIEKNRLNVKFRGDKAALLRQLIEAGLEIASFRPNEAPMDEALGHLVREMEE